jgi:V8-like Glu-specific endopeptidase
VPVLRLRSIVGTRRGPESVFSGPRVRIGRSRDNDLILPEKDSPAAGGHHADALLDSSGAWWIIDANSANGTLLNGTPVGRHQLKGGDRLTFGDEQFVVAIGGGPAGRLLLGSSLLALVVGSLLALVIVEGLDRRRAAPFEAAAATASRAVFLIAVEENGKRVPIGTAFAIAETAGNDMLVTNAHIAALLEKRGAFSSLSTSRAIAVQGDTFFSRRVIGSIVHPGWRAGSIQKDVALLRLERGLPLAPLVPLVLGDVGAVSRLTRGTPIAAFGFPAVSTDAQRPRGRLAVDVVGDVRGDYLEAGLSIAPGTSGSPVFDQSGVVIGIVAGGDFIGRPGESATPSGSLVNWALTASVVRELLALGS